MPDTDLLQKYAEVAIHVGMTLEPGDRLFISSHVSIPELTRLIVDEAYRSGADNVDVAWTDDEVALSRFAHGSEAAIANTNAATRARAAAFDAGDHMLYIAASDPAAFAGRDAERVALHEKANRRLLEPATAAMARGDRKWCVIAAPSEAWAARVFPDLASSARERLWEAIFRACRVTAADPVAEWQRHTDELARIAGHLTQRRYTGLRYEGPGTDLRVGLPTGALWRGGAVDAGFVPNLPTEEVFTSPHRLRAEGRVAATKPLSLYGTLIDDFWFEFSEGRIVSLGAAAGEDALRALVQTDEGSAYLGETAMVPMSSAVAAERLVWNSTLYDENDGCHIAIGNSYAMCLEGGPAMSSEELAAAGLNSSTAHVDFVVGSDQLNVYGVTGDGSEEPILLGGEWGFTPS